MKDCDSISWIGGEGFPSRYHIGQGEERAEVATCGFQLIEARGKSCTIHKFPYNISIPVHGLHWRKVCICGRA
jgi:hypothetical protein